MTDDHSQCRRRQDAAAPASKRSALADLSLKELRRLKKRSLRILQWGWAGGILSLTVALLFLLPKRGVPSVVGGIRRVFFGLGGIWLRAETFSGAWGFWFFLVFGIFYWYIYTRLRNRIVRVFVCSDAVCMLICAGMLATAFVRGGSIWGIAVSLLCIVVAGGLLAAVCSKMLWGRTYFTYAALKTACERKARGEDISGIMPTEHAESLLKIFFTIAAFWVFSLRITLLLIVPLLSALPRWFPYQSTWLFAMLGDPKEQYRMGGWYATGSMGAKKNMKRAVCWWLHAAEQGHAEAQYELGLCYEKGVGVKAKDMREAAKWYRRAAEQGHVEAQYGLGMCYEKGVGVEARDMREAVNWYRRAARQGHVEAQYGLGLCYEKGIGVEADMWEAVYWYRKAGKQGLAIDREHMMKCVEQAAKAGMDIGAVTRRDVYNKGKDILKVLKSGEIASRRKERMSIVSIVVRKGYYLLKGLLIKERAD